MEHGKPLRMRYVTAKPIRMIWLQGESRRDYVTHQDPIVDIYQDKLSQRYPVKYKTWRIVIKS